MGRVFDNGDVRTRREHLMSYDDLLCAACSGRVVDGGCPTCRLTRQQLPASPRLPAEALLALAALLTVLLIVADHLH
jgi:hypothetical protein